MLMSTSRFLLSLTVALTLPALVLASDEPSLEQRLDKLAEQLEAARVEAHIPGMSIAIVKDDEVVWSRGFGLADVAAERPAEADTIYAIGSTTKAFTATLIGMLVDEGKAGWDDPVTKYLPYFDLAVRSDDPKAECTLRDLLSHRHGFARMGLLWFRSGLSREDVLRTAAGAEPWDDFRAGFHYCNVTYLAAGQAAGVAAGSTWDELMVERIFKPLHMDSSTLSVAQAQLDPRLAQGYKWVDSDGEVELEPMVPLDAIAPAGSVNSNVLDMAAWLRLQMGEGQFDGARLISSERITETWQPQIEIADGMSYGLGWMLHEHHGRRVVEHGGNIDGFSAQVGFMPEENLGYVLLMNLGVASLQQASLGMVFDALLDEWPDPVALAEAAEINFEDYAGVYLANFASFRDEPFEILIQGDHLALDIPSQQTFALKPPGANGKWSFVLTDTIAVSFERDDQGTVRSLRVHQGGFSFEVPREGLVVEPEVADEQLEKYVGTYVRVEGGKRIKIFVSGGRLVMEDKGNRLAFETPDATGHASLRARADQGATFNVDAEGNVESLLFHGSAGDKLFTRLAASSDSELPTLEEVLALRHTDARIAAVKAARGTKVTGTVSFPQAGVHGAVTLYSQGTDRYASHLDLGKFGRIDVVAKGAEVWSYSSMRGLDVLKGDELAQAILGHPGAVEGDWRNYFDSVEVVRNDVLDERPVHVVRLRKGDMPSRTYWVDAENGDVLRVRQVVIEGPIRIPAMVTFSEFELLNGIRTARRAVSENPASGKTVLTFDKFETGLELGDEVFTLEDPDAGN
jgi:CubicO group peptidase (beta-lactamase class C family)